MNFEEKATGDFKIYTGAIERREGGFLAAVVVQKVRGERAPRTVFSAEALSNGYRFSTAHAALQHAMDTGTRELRMMQGVGVA